MNISFEAGFAFKATSVVANREQLLTNSASESVQDPFVLVTQSVEEKLGQLSLRVGSTAPEQAYQRNQTNISNAPTATEVATNIVQFVSDRITERANQGADSSEIEGLFEQAKIGIERGFQQAKSILSGINALSEQLEADIDQSFELTQFGIAQFESDFRLQNIDRVPVTEVEASTDAEPSTSVTASLFERVESNSRRGASEASIVNRAEVQSLARDDFEFSLQTQDGDLVRLAFTEASRESFVVQGNRSAYQSIQVGRYEAVVVGELDEGEQIAIQNLLAQVDELATDFFSGDFQSAFDQALRLGFDGSEIARFSLDLQQRVSESYAVYEKPSSAQALARTSESFASFYQSQSSFSSINTLIERLLLPESLGNAAQKDSVSALLQYLETLSDLQKS